MIATQLALVARPEDAALRIEEERLIKEVLGPLAEWRLALDANPGNRFGAELCWRHGFLDAVRIDGFHDAGVSEDLLWWLFEDPSTRFLRELVIGCHHDDSIAARIGERKRRFGKSTRRRWAAGRGKMRRKPNAQCKLGH